MNALLPEGWPRPPGYSQGVEVGPGRTVYVAGQIWVDADTMSGQVEGALRNIVEILAEAGARPQHVVRMTWFITSIDAYMEDVKALGAAWRSVMGHHYPAMSVINVSGLLDPRALVEIEATAVVEEAMG